METSEKEKELIIARLEVVSHELFFSVGSDNKSFSKDDLILEIKNGSEIGKDFIKGELEFLRALKDGSLMQVLTS